MFIDTKITKMSIGKCVEIDKGELVKGKWNYPWEILIVSSLSRV